MHGDQARFFADEVREHLKHKTKGMVAMASEALLMLLAIALHICLLRPVHLCMDHEQKLLLAQ